MKTIWNEKPCKHVTYSELFTFQGHTNSFKARELMRALQILMLLNEDVLQTLAGVLRIVQSHFTHKREDAVDVLQVALIRVARTVVKVLQTRRPQRHEVTLVQTYARVELGSEGFQDPRFVDRVLLGTEEREDGFFVSLDSLKAYDTET